MVDNRFGVTGEEYEKIINTYFKDGPDGPLSEFPTKEKRKYIVIKNLIKRFEPGKIYTEKEVNGILERAYPDFATLRRYLVDYSFLERFKDGSSYWVKC